MTAYLREVVDVTAVVVSGEYNKKLFNESIETLHFQKYAVGQILQWTGTVDGLLDEVQLPYMLLIHAGSILTPTMLETTYPLLLNSEADVIRTSCKEVEHPDYFIGHSLIRMDALYASREPDIVDIDFVGAICPDHI